MIASMRYTLLYLTLSLISFSSIAQVNTQIAFSRGQVNTHHIIRIAWSENEMLAWETENADRLEIAALKTEIESTSLPKDLTTLNTYKFDLKHPAIIELMIETDQMAKGEKLIFKKEPSGEVIFEIDNESAKRILTPSFHSASTYLEWQTSEQKFESRFTIRTFYLDEVVGNRGPTIGFGTALSCQPNAACKQDSILKLISNSAFRIRMVMDEGIGWCTGSFVNNTRNDRTPYAITAHHCTFEYTPQYDLWRFDLDYKSDSCQNPAIEPQILSLTGCERKAGNQASDCLLLLLNQQIPTNIRATFAGWDRDTIRTPDTSYLIHHPNADIRKISTSINKAVIHPNQIGWSEGYTTPPDHHFHFKFTEGGHQPGSSGGPVFNENGLMIGQHHGGTKGCEIVNKAFIGRFSKSWDGGGTPDTRLKDWLDPDNTLTTQLPSIENLSDNDMIDLVGSIRDPIGNPVNNVMVIISGGINDTVTTNAEGQFFVDGINRNGEYQFVARKNDYQTNGLNIHDLLSIQKHLLAKDTFDFSWQHIAADATNNQSLSVGDIVILLKLLLGKIQFLATSPSWRFDPPQVDVTSMPAGGPFHIEMMGIKIGDVNATADPGL